VRFDTGQETYANVKSSTAFPAFISAVKHSIQGSQSLQGNKWSWAKKPQKAQNAQHSVPFVLLVVSSSVPKFLLTF
jgi:hypothetical protein